MIRARLHRMSSGHIVATFKTDGKVSGTRVVGTPTDSFVPVAHWVKQNFTVDQVGIKDGSKTIWLIPKLITPKL